MIKILLIYLLFSFMLAKESVNVSVDRQKIIEGDSIILTVKANNFNTEPELTLPKLDWFTVANGPSQSSSTNVQFINGQMKKESSFILTWTIIPIKAGKHTIPSLIIKMSQKTFKSQPISIIVSKRGSNKLGTMPKFFIEAEIDNDNPYIGQQVTLKYILYTQLDVSSFVETLPSYKGFWVEEIFTAKNLQLREVKKNGTKYYAATIKKNALFPTRSGKLVIDPLTAIIGIREKQQRWNDFSLFGPPPKKYSIASNRIELEVRPLPDKTNGIQSSIIGNWNIKSNISKKNVEQDEAVTLKVIISGTGNLQTVELEDILFPKVLEVFEPKIQTIENPLRDKIGGEKSFEWVIIPRSSGQIKIPKFQLSYFNSEKHMWLTKSTKEYILQVSPSSKTIATPIGLLKEEVSLVGEDIRFLDESKPTWRNINSGLLNSFSWILLLLSSMMFAFPYANDLVNKRLNLTSDYRLSKKALKYSINILNINNDSIEETYAQIYKSIINYINMKTSCNKVEYSIDDIIQIIEAHGGKRNIGEISEILKRGQTVRFSPITTMDYKKDIIKTKLLLEKIDVTWI